MRPPRNNLIPLILGAVALAAATARGDDVLPQPASPKRYEKLAAHSPFAPPTAPVQAAPTATPPPGPSWSDNLSVTSIMQNGNVYFVTVMEKDSPDHYIIRSDTEDETHHLAVASVKWADKADAVKVTLRKGTQFGDVQFDPSALPDTSGAAPAAAPPPVQPMMRPNLNPQPGGLRPPPGLPAPPQRFPQNNILRNRPPIRVNPVPGAPMRNVITPPAPMRSAPVKPTSSDDDEDN